ncbi:MAG TPA: hypothetical protein VFB83_06915 [Propionibacteriaceae bacterium]|nr:hypothetical protein [Propionibacteriaceae bacterium]
MFLVGVDEETDGLRFEWGGQTAGGDRPGHSRLGGQPQLILLTEFVGLACVDHETAGLARCQQDDHRSAGCEIWMALKRRYGAHEWAWGTTGAPPAALDSVLILSPAAKTLSWSYGRRVRMTIGLPAGASLTARCSTQLWLARLGKTRMD